MMILQSIFSFHFFLDFPLLILMCFLLLLVCLKIALLLLIFTIFENNKTIFFWNSNVLVTGFSWDSVENKKKNNVKTIFLCEENFYQTYLTQLLRKTKQNHHKDKVYSFYRTSEREKNKIYLSCYGSISILFNFCLHFSDASFP